MNIEKGEITLVSAFYEIKSKFPSGTYYEWMKNYLSLPTQMVIFTDSKSEVYIKELRANNQNKTVIIIQELNGTKMYKNIEYWNYCYEIDTEKYLEAMESTFDQLLTALDVNFKSIIGKPRQSNLDELFWSN